MPETRLSTLHTSSNACFYMVDNQVYEKINSDRSQSKMESQDSNSSFDFLKPLR